MALTPASAADLSFESQLAGVQGALIRRREAQKAVAAHRDKCVDILKSYGIDMRGVAVEPDNLSKVLEKIVVYEKAKPVAPDVERLVNLNGYLFANLSREEELLSALRKVGGAKTVKLVKDVATAYTNRNRDTPLDTVLTNRARKEFTEEFNKFAAAKTEYLDSKAVIEDTNEYITIVEKIGNIANNKKGSK